MTTARTRPHPIEALPALLRLARDPDETSHAFAIVQALGGRTPERMLRRYEESAAGRRLLAEKPSLLAALSDTEALRRMPPGSVGHAYLAHLEREGITADGLVEASRPHQIDEVSEDMRFVGERLRDSHDLWHALTGYRSDVLGEAAILAFSLAQTGNPGLFAMVTLGIVRFHSREFTELVAGGFQRGLCARDLTTAHWETLLDKPLHEVRALFGVSPAPAYVPIFTRDLRAEGMLPAREAPSSPHAQAA